MGSLHNHCICSGYNISSIKPRYVYGQISGPHGALGFLIPTIITRQDFYDPTSYPIKSNTWTKYMIHQHRLSRCPNPDPNHAYILENSGHAKQLKEHAVLAVPSTSRKLKTPQFDMSLTICNPIKQIVFTVKS